ncbi:MAG: hypothetical protein B7Z66_14775 [Chromatiales bacterium 21-64-14]|nr:MAG: hypothetical protein B7Z66_14775 [Chromatiales bacterium 21-64-14]
MRAYRMKTTKRSGTPVAVLFAVCGLCVATGPAQALTIVPTFGSSVSASQQAAIDNAIGFYQQSFTDPISVNIDFSVASGVTYAGKSESTFGVYSYRAYSNALASDAATNGNSIEQTAYNNLPYGNTAGYIAATSSNLRALGVLPVPASSLPAAPAAEASTAPYRSTVAILGCP